MEVMLLVMLILSLSYSRTLHTKIYYPDERLSGSSLFIRGDALNLNWYSGASMKHVSPNLWTFDISMDLTKSVVEFKVLVDDEVWQIGANFMVETDCTQCEFTGYPWFYTTQGVYVYDRNIYSKELDNYRDIVTYLPPSYFENTLKTYQEVILACDGQNLFNDSTSFAGAWHIQDTIDRLVYEGGMVEVVVVGIDNTPDRDYEYTYDYDKTVKEGGKADKYLDFVESTVIPLVTSKYRLRAPRYASLGSSLGGLLSCYAVVTRSDVYKTGICMSSSFWWNDESFNNVILVKDHVPDDITIYLDSGDQGDDQDDKYETIRVRDHLETLGFHLGSDLFYYLDKGAYHNEKFWGARFWIPMKDLYTPVPVKN